MLQVVIADDQEVLLCQVCREEFASLERAWLGYPLGTEADAVSAVWGHRRCIDGSAMLLFNSAQYRLKRGDYAFRSLITRLTQRTSTANKNFV